LAGAPRCASAGRTCGRLSGLRPSGAARPVEIGRMLARMVWTAIRDTDMLVPWLGLEGRGRLRIVGIRHSKSINVARLVKDKTGIFRIILKMKDSSSYGSF